MKNLLLILALFFLNLSFAAFNDLSEEQQQTIRDEIYGDTSNLSKEEKELYEKYHSNVFNEGAFLFDLSYEYLSEYGKDTYKNLLKHKEGSVFLSCKEKAFFKFIKREMHIGLTKDRKNALVIEKRDSFTNGLAADSHIINSNPPYYSFRGYDLNTNTNEIEGSSRNYSCDTLSSAEWVKNVDKFTDMTAKNWQKEQAEAKEESRLKY